MSDPRRWLEGGADEVTEALFRSAQDDAPGKQSRSRAMAALGVSTSLAVASAKASAAAAAVTAGKAGAIAFAKWAGILVLGTSAAVGVAMIAKPRFAAPVAAPTAVPCASQQPVPAFAAERPADPGASTPSASVSASATAAPVAPPAATNSSGSKLAEEIALLDTARSALARGDVAAASAALDQHARQFSRGYLAQEATLLRIEALARSGNRGAARALGQRYLSANPSSPHASRVRALIGEPAP